MRCKVMQLRNSCLAEAVALTCEISFCAGSLTRLTRRPGETSHACLCRCNREFANNLPLMASRWSVHEGLIMGARLPTPTAWAATVMVGVGQNLGGSMSSVSLCGQESNRYWWGGGLITVIVIVLVLWPAAAEVVGAYVNATALAAVFAGGGTAAAYRNRSNRT